MNASHRTANNCLTCVSSPKITILDDETRHIYFYVFLFIALASVIANVAAIYSIQHRKVRFVHKSCIVFLASADIFSSVMIGLNNLEGFSHPMTTWTIGPFFCHFVPMSQISGVIASSIALMFIAMDSYWNVVNAMSAKWSPKPTYCIVCLLLVGVACTALGYPMADFFVIQTVTVIFSHRNATGHQIFDHAEEHQMCLSFRKHEMQTYYCCMIAIIFLPLTATFIWFYYNIANLVWKHRGPVGGGSQRDVKVGRKIRTFKIIVTLMLVFIVFRLPYYVGMVINLSLSNGNHGKWPFYYSYNTAALHIINCGLNPFLYTFLTQATSCWTWTKKLLCTAVCAVCCFCCSKSEFEEFEHRENRQPNPFFGDGGNGKSSRVKFGAVQEYEIEKY